MAGRKKAQLVDEIVESVSQQKINLMLDRNTLEFFFEWQGETFKSKDAAELKEKAADIFKANRALDWTPLIEVEVLHNNKPGSAAQDRPSADCRFVISRYYVAVSQKKKIKRVGWDVGEGAPEQREEREETFEAWHKPGLPVETRMVVHESKAEIRMARAQDWHNYGTNDIQEIVNQTRQFPLPYTREVSRKDRAWYPGNNPKAYLPYSEEMWQGLIKLQEAIRNIAEQLDGLLLSGAGHEMIAQVGARLMLAALPATTSEIIVTALTAEEMDAAVVVVGSDEEPEVIEDDGGENA